MPRAPVRDKERQVDATPPEPTFKPADVSSLAVPRNRLAGRLDLATQQRLTMVVAPPGYGKTVLLAQWASAHRNQRVRWLTLEQDDNDVETFTGHLCGALGVGDRPAPDAVPNWLTVGGPKLGRSLLDVVFAQLDGLPPTTLVLDDFHVLTNVTLLDELATLIEQAPRTLHVVLATRVDPPLRYYRLRLADALVELRQEDLAFTSDEAAELVRQVSGPGLGACQIEALVQRTEGWAVGLHLAALSLRERTDPDVFVEAFAGDDRHVASFLTEEVLRRQPDEIRRFLLATCVLDRMSGPLCDFVTGQRGGQATLEELDRTSMLITTLDPRHRWFRYHGLIRTLLRQQLHAFDPALEHEFLLRAAEWYMVRDEVEAAVGYLVDAGAWQQVLDTAITCGREMLARGRAPLVASWIDLVPEAVRQGRVDVVLLQVAGWAIGDDTARAREALDAIDATGSISRGQRLVALLLRSYCALLHGAPSQAVAGADRTLHEVDGVRDAEIPDVLGLTGSRADIVAAAQVIRGVGLVYQGDLAEARDSLTGSLDGSHAMWQVSALGGLALLEAWSGRLTAAEQQGTRALALARQLAIEHEPTTTEAYFALVDVARERGDLDRARALLDEAARRSRPDRRRVVAMLFATEQALLALDEGDAAAGLTILAARRSAEHPSMPPATAARRCAVEAELLILDGDLDSAARALDVAPEQTCEVVAARVRLAVERGDLRTARELLERWPHDPRPRAPLERLLWMATVDHLEGHEAAARSRIVPVLTEAELEQNRRLFRGPHVLGLVRGIYRERPSAFLRAIVDRPATAIHARPVKELVEQLTEREYTLLPLLPTRLSNVEIAESLGVSLNTIKTHLKHIYRKLGVADRSEAIAEAERLRLL